MSIRSVAIASMDVKRYARKGERHGTIQIQLNSKVKRMRLEAATEAVVEWRFSVSYGSIGHIQMEGEMEFKGSKAGKLVRHWEETNNILPELVQEVHHAIMNLCIVEATSVARASNLPPPFGIPQMAAPQQAQPRSDDQPGMEVA